MAEVEKRGTLLSRQHTAATSATRIRAYAPAAVVGSIALSLTVAPAAEAAPRESVRPGIQPLSATRTPVVTTVRAAATAPAARSHTVAAGDTVSGIAARYGLRTADVLAWNDLGWSSTIFPGQKLRLSATGSTTSASTTSKTAPAASTSTYTVRSGDTLWAIAQKKKVSLSALRSANKLTSSSLIHPGQKLSIPGSVSGASTSTPASSTAPSAPAASSTAERAHTVQAGDTMWAIANANGIAVSTLLAANDLQPSSIIYPGQKLTIPAKNATGLDAEQTRNAQIIIQVGRDRGVSDRGIAIALATAMVESWMRNLDWGDRDSLGLFQQRPSAGWGTDAQVQDPHRAAAAFYGGPYDPNGDRTRGLLDIPGWQSMDFTDAAQAVQVSAYPDRYGQWEKKAYSWLAALG